jgi:hypothetical protein
MDISYEGEYMHKKIMKIVCFVSFLFLFMEHVKAEGATCAYKIEGYTNYFICIANEKGVTCRKDPNSKQLGIEEKSLKLSLKDFQKNAIWTCPNVLYGDFKASSWAIKNLSASAPSKVNDTFSLMKDKSTDGGKVSKPVEDETPKDEIPEDETPEEGEPSSEDDSKPPVSGTTNVGVTGCDILGGANSETVQILSTVVKIIRLGVPVLIIVLGILDFMKILFSGEDKVFKESFNRFVKRLGIGVIIIFVPYFLQFLVKLSGIESQYGIDNFFCGIIDATGVSTSRKPADSYQTIESCDNAGYIWNNVKGICVNGNGNTISASDCVESGYIVVSDGNVPGGYRCVKGKNPNKQPSDYKNSFACDNAGYIWNSVKENCVNGNGNTISASDCVESGYKIVSDGSVPGGYRCVK